MSESGSTRVYLQRFSRVKEKNSNSLLTTIVINIIIYGYFESSYQCMLKSFIIIIGGIAMTLKDGKTGMTLRVDSIGESGLKERLMTMGLLPGTKITVLRSAPLGDPIAIGLRSYNLAIRRKDAECIQVTAI